MTAVFDAVMHSVSGQNAHLTLALMMVSVFAGSLVSGLAGFAFSAVAGAILLHWVAPSTAVPLLLACSITTQLLTITTLWRSMRWRQCAPFLIGGVIGIPLGAKMLESLDAQAFAIVFGIFLIAYSTYMLLRPKLVVVRRYLAVDIAAGFAGGLTGGSIAFPGAIPTIWCTARGLEKHEQRGIVQPFILIMQIVTLLYFSRLGIVASGTLTAYLLCMPALLAGTWLGLRMFAAVDEAVFRRIVLVLLLASGTALLL